MSDQPDCPYCGAQVGLSQKLPYDKKVNIRCGNCGGVFEFLPGFGAFSLSEDRHYGSIISESDGLIPTADSFHDRFDRTTDPMGYRRIEGQESGMGTACTALCFFLICIQGLVFIFVILMGVFS